MKQGLGTQLRHLIELMDGAVAAVYDELGLDYRPRYTPVMRALHDLGPCSIGQLAGCAGITQPAATQTVALMAKAGLVSVHTSKVDARQKEIRLTAKSKKMLPQLQQCWQATHAAAASLDADLGFSLGATLAAVIATLEQRSFGERIQLARSKLMADTSPPAIKRVAHKRNTKNEKQ